MEQKIITHEKIFTIQQMRKMLLLAMLCTGLAAGFITYQLTKNFAQEQYAKLLIEKDKQQAEAQKILKSTPYRATIGDEKDLLQDLLDHHKEQAIKRREKLKEKEEQKTITPYETNTGEKKGIDRMAEDYYREGRALFEKEKAEYQRKQARLAEQQEKNHQSSAP